VSAGGQNLFSLFASAAARAVSCLVCWLCRWLWAAVPSTSHSASVSVCLQLAKPSHFGPALQEEIAKIRKPKWTDRRWVQHSAGPGTEVIDSTGSSIYETHCDADHAAAVVRSHR
jgi:hypothetical protein